MWPRLAFCCWGLALVSGWATFQQMSPSRNFSFRFFPEAAPGAPGRLPALPEPPEPGEDAAESKVERLGQAFRRRVRRLRELSERLELVFLVDESSSVGQANFLSELKFVRKLLSDFPVVPTATRVAIVTFSSKNNVVPRVDYISSRRARQHKCALLSREIPAITYRGGGTYTKGAFQQAAQILRHSRENSTKVIFLITDGYSNGGDPRPIAASLRDFGVEIFTFGIWQGNIRELNDMASTPKEEHCYLLHSFEEFEALARRALHEDLPSGSFIQEDMSHCSYLCEAGKDCCDRMASCKCGTHTGQFECICEKGYYGKGLQYECAACPSGTYKPEGSPGGISTCIPCPDENHTSPPGSTSPEDCVCREGYRASGQICEGKKENFLVCNVQALLHLLLFLSLFSKMCCMFSCYIVKTCSHLRQPKHGHISCSTREMSYRTMCLVTCDEGYRLEGSAKLTCQVNAQWDGPEPRCVERHCSTFQKPKGVIMSPHNCGKQPAKPGTICQLSCRKGFILSGVREEVRCTTSGKWSAKVQTAVCKDVEAPQITCPKDIEAKTQEQQDSANITWQVPTAKDNSGEKVSIQVHPAFTPPYLFPIGDVAITYTAVDLSGNQASCTFHVKVIDVEPPVIDWCRSPPPIQVSEKEHSASWDEPQFSDNSGAVLDITRSHTQGDLFPHGETIVRYTATDPSGNNRTCDIHIVIKGILFISPQKSSCLWCAIQEDIMQPFDTENDADDIDCRLEDLTKKYCLEYNYDYENGFAIGPGGWGAANRLDYSYDDFLDAVQETPTSIGKARSSRIKRSAPLSDHKIKLIFNITASVPLPDERNDTLELENQQRLIKTLETITNRLKRTLNKEPMYSFQLASEMLVADTNSLETEKAFLFCRPGSVLRGRMCGKPLLCDQRYLLNIMINYITFSFFSFLAQCKQGTYSSNGLETCESCPLGTYQPEFGSRSCLLCPENTSTVKRGAVDISACGVPCPVGEFSRSGLMPCYPCPQDYYQPNPGKSFCLSCPFYGTTTITGARSITDCSSFSSTFSAAEESIVPLASPGHIKKKYEVSSQVFHECFLNPCHNGGTCQQLGRGYVCVCLPGYTGLKCEIDIDECSSLPCLNNGICKDRVGEFFCECPLGYTGQLCEENINECSSSPCLNKGTCVDGLAGYLCTCMFPFFLHSEVNECQSSPCLNNAVCEDQVGGFLCKCPPGFLGTRCEKNVDECLSQPCKNGATCKDGANSFRCQCAAGFTGSHCELNINECQSNPCRNQATCVDALNSYSCKCRPGFSGSRCETEQSTGFNLDFEVYGIYGYVMLDGVLPSLHAVTCTFWMKSSDITNYGTPISYALENGILSKHMFLNFQVKSLATSCPEELSRGNVLAWPDFLTGIVGKVKIDSKSIFCSDCPPLDGSVPHLRTASVDLKPGSKVSLFCDPGFQMVGNPVQYCLNQGQWTQPLPHCERESSLLKSLQGFLKNVGIVRTLLRTVLILDVDECAVGSDCSEHASCLNTNGSYICSCIPPYTGDGKNCAEPVKCKAPGNPENGHSSGEIYTVGAEVTFSCEDGYQLMGVTKITCLESGEWNHLIPYCEGISCGVPPPLENGFYSAEDFHAGSTVTYQCNKGYTLAGDKESSCLASGSWSHFPPVCELVQCSSPESINNGNYILSGLTYLSTASYSCESGYSLQGPSTIECTASGSWDRAPPTCHLVFCGEPPAIKDAVITGSNFTFGNTVTYTCKEGYTLAGPDTIECLANGKWSGSNQQCLAVSCDEPPHVDHASPETAHRLFGDIAFYYCSDGYSLADNSQLLCNAQGKWVPPEGQDIPRCIAHFCEKPSSVSYSILESVSKAKFAAGSVVSFKCMEGFVLNTSAKIECMRGGQWSPSPMSIQCIPVRCGEPPSITNGYASGSNYSFGAMVAYSCKKGFYIKGEKKSTCEATGQWSSPMPTCHPVSCNEPPKVENGFLEHTTGRIFESEVRYQCNPGYKSVGSPVFVCQANRHWHSESPLSCMPLNCGKPPPIQNGFMKGENFEVGSKVQFFCNEGYELIGDSSWTCQKSGKWNKKPNQKCVPAKCPEPPLLENQLVLKELTTEVGVVMFSCKEGHALQGPAVLKCLPSQQWNDSFPVCKMVLCLPPPLISFGVAAPSSALHFGSTVKYSCVDGFFLRGDPTTLCQADGTWSSPLPECVPVECPQPEEILNGIIDVQGLAYLSTALYTCKPGFELVGNATTLCGENGHWLGGKPTCKPIECPKPKEILNGKFSYTNLHFGQTITYSCDRGFRLEGPKALTCLETGDWDVDAPSCNAIHCHPPQPIENGFVEGADYSYGAMIIYSCFPGFQVAGHAMQTCEESGWSSSIPTCVPIDCGLPPHIDFGDCTKVKDGQGYFEQEDDMMEVPYLTPHPPHHLGAVTKTWENTKESPATHSSNFLYGTMVSYTCNPGYELLGNPVLICQEDGTWNGSAPSCISIECDLPIAPENGFLRFTETTMGSAVQYSCKVGHVVVGSDVRLCLQNRKWSGASPHCEAISCKKPNPVMNGSIKGSNYTYLSVLYYECDPGYVLNGTETRTCQENKNWDGNEPICIPVDCGSPPVPANGQVKGDEHTFQKEIEYICNEGFLLEGAGSHVCLANGSWSGATPDCVPVRCATPPQVANGVMEGLDYDFMKEVVFHCWEGYVLHGAPKLTCQSDGNWDAEVPVCKPVNCGPPEDLAHGFPNGFSFLHGGHIQYQCFPGYKLHGSSSRRCLSNGSWSGSPPSCLPCRCSTPVIQYGTINGTDFGCGKAAWIQCFKGFTLLGSSEITCEANGQWSSDFPHCEHTSCGSLPMIPNAFISESSSLKENVITYSCRSGYVIQGSSDLICGEKGTWSQPYPVCEPLSCGPPPTVENAVATGETHTYESKVKLRCLEGYTMDKDIDTFTCQKDGHWFPERISCSPKKCPLPGNITHILVHGDDFSVNKQVSLSCAEGYTYEGVNISTCQVRFTMIISYISFKPIKVDASLLIRIANSTISWSGSKVIFNHDKRGNVSKHFLFFLTANPCPVPFVIPENALLSEKEFYVDQNVSVKCREGFLLQGQGVITCNPDETWTQTSAKCEKISCGPPVHVENAIARGIHYQYGDMITYSCYSGYMLEGSLRSVCLGNGTWTSPPICRAVCRFPCQNGGICQRPNACSCPDGWMGRLCEEPICILPCLNGGRCVAPYQCDCPPGWTGSRCHTAVCQSPCLNGGKCVRPNRCHCLSTWTGHDCSRKRRTGF
uniref:Sushi, von Willebrand factor type A, EGF and pentraxin domain-containing protein 1 n=1 Tax=Propithecus coquereli TaxID=379532 RepID=A0A2K6EQD9_PROCO